MEVKATKEYEMVLKLNEGREVPANGLKKFKNFKNMI
jgi:hypothetical protein